MKDQATRATLLRGACENGVYMFPNSMSVSSSTMVVNVHERTSLDGCHKHLGHLLVKIVQNFVKHFSLPLSKNKVSSLCNPCSINKTHEQPFVITNFQSHSPLELIYTDIWRPAHNTSIDGSQYYLLLVDHFTKYMWLHPMSTKSSVSTIFPQFKNLIEILF